MLNFELLTSLFFNFPRSNRGYQSLACLFLFPALALVLPPLTISHLPLSTLLARQRHPPLLENQNLLQLD
jgi:hypothetical protein